MRVLVVDAFPAPAIEEVRREGFEVRYEPDCKGEALARAVAGQNVLVVRSTEVGRAVIEAADALHLILRAGAGVNTIDRAAASERGIYVSNCPGKNAVAVAELAVALLLALDRRVVENVADLRAGRWNKKEYGKAAGLYGKTVGILGLGRIGLEVLARVRALGMEPLAWSRSLTAERAAEIDVGFCESPEALAPRCDAVTVHLALTKETRGRLGGDFFGRMRERAIFLNTSRAEIVDEAALAEAVRSRGVRAGLDVFAGEPAGGTGAVDNPLFALPGVYGTHHIGASTEQAQAAISAEAVRILKTFRSTGRVLNCVNLAEKSPARFQIVVRHYDKVGVLANVLGLLKQRGINIEEMENQIFEGAKAACCRIQLDDEPTDEVLAALRARSDEILSVELVRL